MLTLPIDSHANQIRDAMQNTQRLILCAPPGTGKSTRVPSMLMDCIGKGQGQILVLQPRRIAARSLAARVAEEHNTPLGAEVGYQVRFESMCSMDTRILYMTYGIFIQRLLDFPNLPNVHTVILDEFHERSLDCDGALAIVLKLQKTVRPDLKMVVMSATLESESLKKHLEPILFLEVASPLFPVENKYLPLNQQEPVWEGAHRALRSILHGNFYGSVLIFMPGLSEIYRTADAISELCHHANVSIYQLHGGLDLSAQQMVLHAPENGSCVIISTNVAETSLTIPGITIVIDSGLQRVASYNPERDLDTLYLQSISIHSATQRAGRAGRTSAGICIRLWPQQRESSMPLAMEPEIRRVDLMPFALKVYSLAGKVDSLSIGPLPWLDAPSPVLWSKAQQGLIHICALNQNGITELGKKLSKWPTHPLVSRALLAAKEQSESSIYALVSALMAIIESDYRSGSTKESNLLELGYDLVQNPNHQRIHRELRQSYLQLLSLGHISETQLSSIAKFLRDPDYKSLYCDEAIQCLLFAFSDRIAARQLNTQSFVLTDGRRGTIEPSQINADIHAILALELHEKGGMGKSRSVAIPMYVPLTPDAISRAFPAEVLTENVREWDESKERVVSERHQIFRGLIISRKILEDVKSSMSGSILAEKLISDEISLPPFNEETQQWLLRLSIAAKTCPEIGLPNLDTEDWHLIYHEIASGKSSLKQLEDVSILSYLRAYIGESNAAWLDREAPTSIKLPGPRRGKITYFADSAPEVSARLGDFIGLEGKTYILQKRLQLTYDILAPNYRTVQKTTDLTSFWQNIYPEVKKELKRRYPKHPWP